MASKKSTAAPVQHATDLRTKLREALEITNTDSELVENIITSGVLETAIQAGTYNTEEAAEVLGIGIKSVRTLATKSAIFPRPTIKERRYARNDIETYANTRQKKTPRKEHADRE